MAAIEMEGVGSFDTWPDAAIAASKRIAELERIEFAETQKREQFEEEVWCAHKWLDDRGVPRVAVGGEVFSLIGRMMRLVESKSNP